MEREKKKLRINAALVDMTHVAEESLAAYTQIEINAAQVLTSARTRALIGKYNVQMKAASVQDVPEDAKLNIMNGRLELMPDMCPQEPTVLIVNGSTLIHPGAGDTLKAYAMLMINGSILCPDDLRGALSAAMINGSVNYYPAEAKLVNEDLVIDRRFLRRAEAGDIYYVRGKAVMMGENLDFQSLIEKDITIMTGTAILRAEYEEIADLIDGAPTIHIVPEGYAFIDGGVEMNEAIPLQHGKKLFIYGDLSISEDMEKLAAEFEDILITGRLKLNASQKRIWLKIVSRFGGLWAYTGKLIEDQAEFVLSKSLLESCGEGVTIVNCVNLRINPDIPPTLLREKIIALEDCVDVHCAKEQLDTIHLLAKNCVNIQVYGEAEVEEEIDDEWVTIKAAMHTM